VAIRDLLNVDFENAPYNVEKNNFIGQKIEYIIKNNKVFNIYPEEKINFQYGLELPKPVWSGKTYNDTNYDLQ